MRRPRSVADAGGAYANDPIADMLRELDAISEQLRNRRGSARAGGFLGGPPRLRSNRDGYAHGDVDVGDPFDLV